MPLMVGNKQSQALIKDLSVGRLQNGNVYSKNRSNNFQLGTRMKTLYGEPAFLKLKEQELAIQERFDNERKKNKPEIWPNIPMRF